MKDNITTLLSTRPLDETLVNEALTKHVVIESISFIKTGNIIDRNISEEINELASKTITAIFTSMNAAEAVIESLQKSNALQPQWNIYCIGGATESLIRSYFNLAAIAGNGRNAIELAEAVISNNVKEVVFFCGNQRRDELPEYLRKRNILLKEIVVYETNEIPVKIDKEYNGILFFSPSAVKSFFSVNSIPSDTVLFSIGNTTAEAIRNNSDNKIIISDFPSKEKLVDIAISYFDKTNKPND
ncbi:uroporphyrinogen-III synthase [Segetibacter koreensis]|uniref:uroporphyrinogen-III synthase n=1 Tax=Segetibacter koreensis TaxID=398037 RepID=UPI00036FF8B1|nr:uroporphyrinogen-III synthase [Segetibacter koreensis]